MTDRPILFSAPMVQALLAGAKTQTRRTLARQPQDHHWRHLPNYNLGVTVLDAQGGTVASFAHTYRADPVIGGAGSSFGVDKEPLLPLRYAPGDRLWVRERWAVSTIYDGVAPRDVPKCGVRYAATDERLGIKDRPSIFMPRWASRLTLTVAHVRVQRLQDISEEDAKAEGIDFAPRPFGDWSLVECPWPLKERAEDEPPTTIKFANLWNTLNGDKPGRAWADNPWVVALTFTVGRHNIDAQPVMRETAA